MEYVPIAVGIGIIWAIYFSVINTKSTVWILKNREEYVTLALLASVSIGAIYLLLVNFANEAKVYQNKEIIIAISVIVFILLRIFIGTKKAPEENDLSDAHVKQYRVFNDIDLEETFKYRVGKLEKWNMQGDKAYTIVNVNPKEIEEAITGFREIVTDDVGFPIDVRLTEEVKENLKILIDDPNMFSQVVGYELSTNKKILSKNLLYKKILESLQNIYRLYENVLGPLDLNERIKKYKYVELALLDAVNSLSVAKIPINLVQLYAIAKEKKEQDMLGAIKNIVQEKTVQKEGIYLYSLFLIIQASLRQTQENEESIEKEE